MILENNFKIKLVIPVSVSEAEFANIILDHIEKNGPAKPIPKNIVDSIKDGSFFDKIYFD